MPYSEPKDVRLVLRGYIDPEMGDDPNRTPASLTDAQIEYEISNADAQIDEALRRRYILPLPTVPAIPAILKTLSVDIAATLCDMTFRGSREYGSVLAPARLRYERALSTLERIAAGDYRLYNIGEGPALVVEEGVVINPYDTDILLTADVFPKGTVSPVSTGAEFAEEPMPYHPYVRGSRY